MDIQAASMQMSQSALQEQAAIRVEAMSLSAIDRQSDALSKLIKSAQVITDPNLGNNVDFTA
jgi:transcription elongation GreA/GreB family factor